LAGQAKYAELTSNIQKGLGHVARSTDVIIIAAKLASQAK